MLRDLMAQGLCYVVSIYESFPLCAHYFAQFCVHQSSRCFLLVPRLDALWKATALNQAFGEVAQVAL